MDPWWGLLYRRNTVHYHYNYMYATIRCGLECWVLISQYQVWLFDIFFLTLQFFFFISPYISYHKIKLRLDDAFVVIYLTRPEKHFSRISNGSLLRRKKDVRTWITLSVSLSLSHNSHFYTNYWYNQWLIQIFIIKVTQNVENFSSKGQFFLVYLW